MKTNTVSDLSYVPERDREHVAKIIKSGTPVAANVTVNKGAGWKAPKVDKNTLKKIAEGLTGTKKD